MDRLIATVQPYAWGDHRFIAGLQSRSPSGQPEAELWMGAHPRAPSRIETTGVGLDEVIAASPVAALGSRVAERFGQLPYLAKVLSAATPLSIQAHPTLAQARDGFAREEARGIGIDDPSRTYRDQNHKPELICALTDFEAKCGFRALAETRELFSLLADHHSGALGGVLARLNHDGDDRAVLSAVLEWLLYLHPDDAARLVEATVDAASNVRGDIRFERDLDWTREIAHLYPGDPGVVVALLLNHVVLSPGQAMFLGAGNLHAYLRGSGIELMANSDNVVRGGLTPKHVDVAELIEVVDASPIEPPIQDPEGPVHTYSSPVSEFSLTRAVVEGAHRVEVSGPEIVLATEGGFVIESRSGNRLEMARGQPLWVGADEGFYEVSGHCTLFRFTVGESVASEEVVDL